MPTLFEAIRLKGNRAIVYPMHEPWLDVGRPADYAEAGKALSRQTLENGRK
jgi:NDP-sugar pyrophosphorylase family protein